MCKISNSLTKEVENTFPKVSLMGSAKVDWNLISMMQQQGGTNWSCRQRRGHCIAYTDLICNCKSLD